MGLKDGTVTSQNFGDASNIKDNGNESYQMTFYNTSTFFIYSADYSKKIHLFSSILQCKSI